MGKKILTILFSGVLSFITVYAQPPDTLWTKTYGGNGNDCGSSVQQTGDGGYIIAGYTESYGAGDYDGYLIKTDASGNQLWSQTFGGSDVDCCISFQQASDGGYIIAGYTESYGAGSADVYLIKTDASGSEQWSQTFGGSEYDSGKSIQQTSDGGYIIAGYTYSYGAGDYDVYLIKTDASGIEQWSQTFGGYYDEQGYSVQQTSDGGYIIVGLTYSYGAGGSDVYLIKIDGSGNEQWSRTFGGNDGESGRSVQQTNDGGYIIAGYTFSYGAGLNDVYLIKTDASGYEQWNQTFGGSDYDFGYSVQQTSNDGYIIAGNTESYGTGDEDVYLIKTDASGNEQWSQTLGGRELDRSRSVQQTSDGGYIIAGYTRSYGTGGLDVWVIRLEPDITPVTPSNLEAGNLSKKFHLYPATPNPFNPTTTIRFDLPITSLVNLKVFDIQGRLVGVQRAAPVWFHPGHHQITFDGTSLSSGIYPYRLTAGDFTASGKMVLLK